MPTPIKNAWIRPHPPPPKPTKPVDPISSNLGLLAYFAGTNTRHRSSSPTKKPASPPKKGGVVSKEGGRRKGKVKVTKGLGLEGLEGLQWREPSVGRGEVVEVLDEGTEYGYEDDEVEVVEVVQERSRKRPLTTKAQSVRGATRYHDDNASITRSYHRPPPPPPPVITHTKSSTTPRPAAAAAGRVGGMVTRNRIRSDQGPLPHISTLHHHPTSMPRVGSAREVLERGIRERKLERWGREERGGGYPMAGGYAHTPEMRMVGYGEGMGRVESGSRAMREAITPLVM